MRKLMVVGCALVSACAAVTEGPQAVSERAKVAKVTSLVTGETFTATRK